LERKCKKIVSKANDFGGAEKGGKKGKSQSQVAVSCLRTGEVMGNQASARFGGDLRFKNRIG